MKRWDEIEVPELEHDKMMREEYKHKVHARGTIERRCVAGLLNLCLENGFRIIGVDDGEEQWWKDEGCSTQAAMERIFAVDESYAYVQHIKSGRKHWIRIILGNGVDCISDYSYADGDPDGFNKLVTSFYDVLPG